MPSPFSHFGGAAACPPPRHPRPAPSPCSVASLPSLPISFQALSLSPPLSCRLIVNFGSAVSDLGCLPPLFAPALAAEILAVSLSPPLPSVPAPWGRGGPRQPPAPRSAGPGAGLEQALGLPTPHPPALQKPEAGPQRPPSEGSGTPGQPRESGDACRIRPPTSPAAGTLPSTPAGLGCRSSPPGIAAP